jgi:hypothetical protein
MTDTIIRQTKFPNTKTSSKASLSETMRRAVTSNITDCALDAAPLSSGSIASGAPRSGAVAPGRSTKRQGQKQPKITSVSSTRSTSSKTPSYQVAFFTFVLLLFVVDVVYLYKISSKASLNNNQNHSSDWKGTHLSFLSSHASQSEDSQTSKIIAKRLPPLPPPLENYKQYHEQAERNHHKQQQAQQEERYPPVPPKDMLQEQAFDSGFHNLNDKGPILNILQQAGMRIEDLDQETLNKLPTWSQVQSLYGTSPIIVGLETCDEFVETASDPTVRFFGVAGTFNTGTNLVAQLMAQNCQITERMMVYGNESRGVRWQVRERNGMSLN